MRAATWVTAAIAMLGCGQGLRQQPTLGSAGSTADGGAVIAGAPDAGSAAGPGIADGADAGVSDAGQASSDVPDAGGSDASVILYHPDAGTPTGVERYCDPAVDPAEGIAITATGACPGLLPAAPDCAAQVELCPGWSPSGMGIFAFEATSDAYGAVALSCTDYDSGNTSYRVGLAAARYAPDGRLGGEVAPMSIGFVSTPVWSPGPVGLFAHDGSQLASITVDLPHAIVMPDGIALVSREAVSDGWNVRVQVYASDATARGSLHQLGQVVTTSGIGIGGAATPAGEVLVTWTAYDPFATFGQWLAGDGTPLTEAFDLTAAGHAGVAAALPGGSVAVGDWDATGVRWRGVVPPRATAPLPAPDWLASRALFALVRGGTAMLFSGGEIVAADGTSCGAIRFADGGRAMAGADGTILHGTADGKSFRIYPQLLR